MSQRGRHKEHGGSFNTARKQLIEPGYVFEVRNLVEIQAAGFEYLGGKPAAAAPSRAALIGEMIDALPASARDILPALMGAGSPRTAEMLGAALDRVPRGGPWNTGIAILRNNGPIEETPAGFVLSGVLRMEVDRVAGSIARQSG